MRTLEGKLDADAYTYLRCRRVTTSTAALDELLVYAAIHDATKSGRQGHRGGGAHTGQGNRNDKKDTTEPMDVDAVEVQKRKSNARKPTKEQESTDVTTTNYKDFKLLPVLTEKLRTFLKENKGCFFCRELNADHGARECPKKKKRTNFQ